MITCSMEKLSGGISPDRALLASFETTFETFTRPVGLCYLGQGAAHGRSSWKRNRDSMIKLASRSGHLDAIKPCMPLQSMSMPAGQDRGQKQDTTEALNQPERSSPYFGHRHSSNRQTSVPASALGGFSQVATSAQCPNTDFEARPDKTGCNDQHCCRSDEHMAERGTQSHAAR